MKRECKDSSTRWPFKRLRADGHVGKQLGNERGREGCSGDSQVRAKVGGRGRRRWGFADMGMHSHSHREIADKTFGIISHRRRTCSTVKKVSSDPASRHGKVMALCVLGENYGRPVVVGSRHASGFMGYELHGGNKMLFQTSDFRSVSRMFPTSNQRVLNIYTGGLISQLDFGRGEVFTFGEQSLPFYGTPDDSLGVFGDINPTNNNIFVAGYHRVFQNSMSICDLRQGGEQMLIPVSQDIADLRYMQNGHHLIVTPASPRPVTIVDCRKLGPDNALESAQCMSLPVYTSETAKWNKFLKRFDPPSHNHTTDVSLAQPLTDTTVLTSSQYEMIVWSLQTGKGMSRLTLPPTPSTVQPIVSQNGSRKTVFVAKNDCILEYDSLDWTQQSVAIGSVHQTNFSPLGETFDEIVELAASDSGAYVVCGTMLGDLWSG
mmetsp:Transcript_7933/g.14548  ORF Transcript_7933/g.14548 Transcript_7933/m.14548 type:complete len:433 (-) Transcript_7933:4070-5368(-)